MVFKGFTDGSLTTPNDILHAAEVCSHSALGHFGHKAKPLVWCQLPPPFAP